MQPVSLRCRWGWRQRRFHRGKRSPGRVHIDKVDLYIFTPCVGSLAQHLIDRLAQMTLPDSVQEVKVVIFDRSGYRNPAKKIVSKVASLMSDPLKPRRVMTDMKSLLAQASRFFYKEALATLAVTGRIVKQDEELSAPRQVLQEPP